MKHYLTYRADDFLQDDKFRDWVLKGDPEGNVFWQLFMERYPEKQKTVLLARAMLKALHELEPLAGNMEKEKTWELISEEIQAEQNSEPRREPFPIRWGWLSAASVILMALGLGWFFVQRGSFTDHAAYEYQVSHSRIVLTERKNDSSTPQKVKLPDASTVVLQPGSKVSFQENFEENKREVYLNGEGFFDVRKDNGKPFTVYANRLVVQVVGTSFTVRSDRSEAAALVKVATGKVKVFAFENFGKQQQTDAAHFVTLIPNQQVTYDLKANRFAKALVKEPVILSAPIEYPDFYFSNTAVGDIFKTLEKSYGVTIRYSNDNLARCNLTAPLGNEPLFRKLDIICQTIGATYEVFGTEIVITGQGCNP